MARMLSSAERHLAAIRGTILRILGDHPATVYLFGSHATGRAHALSDVDVAIDPARPLPASLLSRIIDELEESTIPYHVDVVDLSKSSPAFRDRVKREGVVWSR